MLTTGQVAHFETFGSLVLKGLFSDAEVSSIRRDYDSVWSEVPGGDPFTGERTEARLPFCVPGRETPGYPMETHPADLLMFDSRAYHGAFGGRSGRSMMQLLFFLDPAQKSDVETLHQIYDRTDYILRVAECFLNSNRPRIQRMIATAKRLGLE